MKMSHQLQHLVIHCRYHLLSAGSEGFSYASFISSSDKIKITLLIVAPVGARDN